MGIDLVVMQRHPVGSLTAAECSYNHLPPHSREHSMCAAISIARPSNRPTCLPRHPLGSPVKATSREERIDQTQVARMSDTETAGIVESHSKATIHAATQPLQHPPYRERVSAHPRTTCPLLASQQRCLPPVHRSYHLPHPPRAVVSAPVLPLPALQAC